MKEKIKKSIMYILTNGVTIVIGVLINYMIPAGLPIEQYGDYRMFVLCLPYFSLLHIGYIDGIYLTYREKENIKEKEMTSSFKALLYLRLFTTIVSSIIVMFLLDSYVYKLILITSIINSFFLNLTSFFNYVAQAQGDFNICNRILIITKISMLIFVMFMYITKSFSLELLILFNIVSSVLGLLYVLTWYRKYFVKNIKVNFKATLFIIKKGIYLLLSNLIISFILGADKIISKGFLTVEEYANYNFAGTIINIIYQMATACGSILFAYFKKEDLLDKKKYTLLEKWLIMLVGVAINALFVNEWIIDSFLPEYHNAVEYLNYLVPSIMMLAIIQIIHSTIYKMLKKNNIYFVITIIIFIFEVVGVLSTLTMSYSMFMTIFVLDIVYILWYILDLIWLVRNGKRVIDLCNIFLMVGIFILYFISINMQMFKGILLYNLIIIVLLLYFAYGLKKERLIR